METFRYKVVLTVEVEAFDSSDAWEAVQDSFGLGESGALVVKDFESWELAQ